MTMPDEIDIFRSANLLIDQLGESALTFAAQQAVACWERGNLDGKAVWLRVIRAMMARGMVARATAGRIMCFTASQYTSHCKVMKVLKR